MKMPTDFLNKLSYNKSFEGCNLDKNILKSYGIFILRNVISKEIVSIYRNYYNDYKNSINFDRNQHHLTEVRISDENPLFKIVNQIELSKIGLDLFPEGIGIYNIRIVKKDEFDISPVFLHQDVGYQYGSLDRYSLFIPLSKCYDDNGGLSFVPGSHNFGYLGDAGAIKESLIPLDLKIITPKVDVGDIIIMNSYTWHSSGENKDRTERIYYDIHINSCHDPASRYLIPKEDTREYILNYDNDNIFSNSRLQRLASYKEKYGAI